MWYKNLLICLASFEVANAFGTVPPTVNVIPDKFTLRVPDRQIQDLKSLLAASRVGPETWYNKREDERFDTTRQWLTEAKHAWLKFDWRKQEKRINSVPNFKSTIKDADVGDARLHVAALFSAKKDALPLLFLHGWPGSFLEFLPMWVIPRQKYIWGLLRCGTHFGSCGAALEPAHGGSQI
ncbi:hypothetical protein AK830_g3413 [Neonectria ditissima]|uniref:Epoxide hydrolase N-terminal domain-containing protein n=1 Tax=Neonectria ditissima TaxID=78410 RepID=A0A0P7BI56_9HYPO|nr:hypothetical protein AK830_g3413 [Neonectria ditissima]